MKTLRQIQRLQEEQLELARHQFDRAEKLNDRAEAIQDKSANLMSIGRKAFMIIIPILIILILYVSWLLFSLH